MLRRGSRLDSHGTTPYQANTSKLTSRLLDVFLRTYDLGFTAFGGPPVHFQILHRRFVDGVEKPAWIDEQTVIIFHNFCFSSLVELFFFFKYPRIIRHHSGIAWPGIHQNTFYPCWHNTYSLSFSLFGPFWALLPLFGRTTYQWKSPQTTLRPSFWSQCSYRSASVQLARKAITDPLMSILVAFGGCAGLCFNALWYFPVLIVFGGSMMHVWDCLVESWVGGWRNRLKKTTVEPRKARARGQYSNAGHQTWCSKYRSSSKSDRIRYG